MPGGQWEVVGGKSKKTKQKNGVNKNSKDKKKQENANYEVSAAPPPIAQAQTLFNVFLEKEKKEPPKPKATVTENVKNKDKGTQQKKKKDKKNTSPSKVNLEEKFSEITEDDVKNLLATLEVLCPNTPFVWLKDFASFLNVKLDSAIEDPVFSGKPIGYPSILLSKGVYDLMIKTFNRCTLQMLELFFEHCLQNMVQDTLKGIHTLGYRVVLQCLAQQMPSVVTANLAKCTELCNSHQNRQNICLSLMWAAGQAGNIDLEAGFHVWTDLMFPMIGTKTCTTYAVDYLEKLVCCEDLSKMNKSIIGVKDLFHILDFIFSKDLVKSVQKRLISFYPTLKTLSYGPEPENVLRNYFPSYLHRLNSQCPQALKEEILSSLVYCLEKDTRNYSIWRQLYSKHFSQSKMLIAHLNEQWEKLPPKFPRKCLFDTLSVFQVTNEELLSSGKKEAVVEECIAINKELLSKINSQMFSWIRAVLLFILIFSLLLTYDILKHDSFIESHTGKLMKDTGVLVICTQAGEKLTYYYGKTYKLLEIYVPTIVLKIQKTFGPYCELFWKQLVNACACIWKSSSSVRIFCGKYIHAHFLLIDAHAPYYGNWLWNTFRHLGFLIRSHCQTVAHYILLGSGSVVSWMSSNDLILNLVESLTQFLGSFTNSLHSNAALFFNFIKGYIPL